MKKRFLVLTADAGFGHRRAAEAIEAALVKKYPSQCDVTITSPFQDPALPDIIRMVETGYGDTVIDDPTLYQLAYTATDAPVVAQLLQDVTTTVLNKTLTRLVQTLRPDAIVTTYPAFTQAAIRAGHNADHPVPVNVVVTDLVNVHSVWFHKGTNLTFVPTGHVYKQALDSGLDKKAVHLTGLPVHPQFADEERDRATLREALGWKTDITTALIVGSSRTRETAAIARLLDRSGLPLQIVAVSGDNRETNDQLRATEWKSTVHIYGMVSNLPEMMHAADFIICKAGGLIVTEALACGLPLILYEALPGQEVGNVRYVVDNGAGAWSPGPIGALTTAYAWLARDLSELKKHALAAQHVGKPHAAYDIAERVFRQTQDSNG
ncbi:MAG: glycosyltransferase [Anaerolineae bacterium]|nr:glycosyltransferase [Anaerolineae bacterium]